MKYEVPFTPDQSCLEVTFQNENIDIGRLMPLYRTIYNKYWDMVIKPLNAINNACRTGSLRQEIHLKRDIQTIDQVKIKGYFLLKYYLNETINFSLFIKI